MFVIFWTINCWVLFLLEHKLKQRWRITQRFQFSSRPASLDHTRRISATSIITFDMRVFETCRHRLCVTEKAIQVFASTGLFLRRALWQDYKIMKISILVGISTVLPDDVKKNPTLHPSCFWIIYFDLFFFCWGKDRNTFVQPVLSEQWFAFDLQRCFHRVITRPDLINCAS